MHTAQHLAKYALSEKLAHNRTIILVAHHISLCLPIAGYLVELSKGAIIRQGSVQELESQGQLKKLVENEDVVEEVLPGAESTTLVNEADIGNGQPTSQKKSTGKLVDAEARAEGRVALGTYLTYIKATGTWSWVLMLSFMVLSRIIDIGNQVRTLLVPVVGTRVDVLALVLPREVG